MRYVGALFFFLLAIVAGVCLVLFWGTLGQYTVVLYSIHLPWLTMRAVVALGAVGFAFRAVQMTRPRRARYATTPAMVPLQPIQPIQPQQQTPQSQQPSDNFRF